MFAGTREATTVSEVEVDLYSGRLNPRFSLDAETEAELVRRLAALPPLGSRAVPREGLGYRGLRIEGQAAAPFSQIVVSDGVVLVYDRAGGERQFADPGRTLERWLVETSAAHLAPGELDMLRQDFTR
jgi:hypothetical protein